MRPHRLLLIGALCGAALTFGPAAQAGGLELLPGGTQSVARGGAVMARPSDPMALLHNPAGLTKLSGDQIMLDVDVPFQKMCVDPYGYYGWGVYNGGGSEFGDPLALDDPNNPTVGATYASSPLPKVCNSAATTGIPELAWTHRINKDWAFGFGFLIPTGLGGLQYGGADGTIPTEYGPRPTPTRYSLVKQEVLFGLNPTAGVAYRIIPQLSVGTTVQILMVKGRAVVAQNSSSGTQPSTDWLTTVETEDFFVPAATVSLNANPIDTVDLMASFHWVDNISGPGNVVIETNTFHKGAPPGEASPFKNDPIDLANVTVRLPWSVTAGARYAAPLPDWYGSDSNGLGDPVDTELWDVEVDATYSLNGRASRASVQAGEDVNIVNLVSGQKRTTSVGLDELSRFDVDHHLKDSVVVRAGASYAVVPRQAMLLAGGFYETRGVEIEYADVDTFAFARVGFGLGAVLRFGHLDVRGAYGHIFSETVELAPPPHQPVEDAVSGNPRSGFDETIGGSFNNEGTRTGGHVLRDPSAPAPENADAVAAKTQKSAVATDSWPERIINAGRYTAAFNVVSVGVVYHF